jgi:hypothetical protein
MASKEELQEKNKKQAVRLREVEALLACAVENQVAAVADVGAALLKSQEEVMVLLRARVTLESEYQDMRAQRDVFDVQAHSWREQFEVTQAQIADLRTLHERQIADLRAHYEQVAAKQLRREKEQEAAILNRKAIAGAVPGARR